MTQFERDTTMSPFEATITEAEAGQRLDRCITALCNTISRSRIKSLIEGGYLALDGETISNPGMRVKPGQHFVLSPPEERADTLQPEPCHIPIIHEDESIIVVDKPAGMVVHPGSGTSKGTLVNALLGHCGGSFIGSGDEQRGGIVHRLDKETSGLIVVAKTQAAENHLIEQFQARTVGRRYLGLAWGCPSPTRGAVEGAIGRSPVNRKKMAVVETGGRHAITHYAVRKALCHGAVSLMDFKLETGRTHQIRVHMTHIGHTLLGDPVYGGGGGKTRRRLGKQERAAAENFPRQALHAADLAFTHPESNGRLSFTSAWPDDMQKLYSALGGHPNDILDEHDKKSHI